MGNYRNTCSCCSDHIDHVHMDFLIETEQADSEGNYCSQCYYDIDRDQHDQLLEVIQKIDDAFSTPIKKFKWRFKSIEEQWLFIQKCMDKGYITWSIGGH